MTTSVEQFCRQCGHCCERWGWGQEATADDIIPWITERRDEILRYVGVLLDNGRRISGLETGLGHMRHIREIRLWQDPAGRPLRYCPFLRRSGDGRAFCSIHDVRPAVCREYAPWNTDGSDYLNVRCDACRDRTP